MAFNLFLPQHQYYFYYNSGMGAHANKMNEKLVINNFRVFSEPTEFKLAPITILTGKNSAGKSSVIKALLLLNDFIRSTNHLELNLHGPSFHKHKMLHFKDALPWGSKSKELSFELSVGPLSCTYSFMVQPDQFIGKFKSLYINNTDLDTSFMLNRDSDFHFMVETSKLFLSQFEEGSTLENVTKLNAELNSLTAELARVMSEKPTSPNDTNAYTYMNTVQVIESRIKIIKENQKKIKSIQKSKIKIEYELTEEQKKGISLFTLLMDIFSKYGNENKSTYSTNIMKENISIALELVKSITSIWMSHLGPNRTQQSRLYTRFNNESEISMVINDYALNQPPSGSVPDNFLRKWMSVENFDIGDGVDVEMIEGEATVLHLLRDKQRINSADMGFGVGQVLTILLKIVLFAQKHPSDERKYLLIEEPESNLHPRLQSLMADMLYDAHKTFKINFLIETHSEYLIRRCMVNVVDQESSMSKEDVSLVYLNNQNNKSQIRQIEINSNGTLSENFGEGFFDEASGHTIKLMNLRKKSQ